MVPLIVAPGESSLQTGGWRVVDRASEGGAWGVGSQHLSTQRDRDNACICILLSCTLKNR